MVVKKSELAKADITFGLSTSKFTVLDKFVEKIEELAVIYHTYCRSKEVRVKYATMFFQSYRCTFSILDHDNLIKTLERTKFNAVDTKSKIDKARVAKTRMEDAPNAYKSVANRGSLLFFCRIAPMYQLSLGTFLTQFLRSLCVTEQTSCVNDRICVLIESLQEQYSIL
jgi:hypothetical protein